MQKKIDILTDLISKSLLKPSQKQIAYDMLSGMVSDYNILENKYQRRIVSIYGIRNDFVDYFDRATTLLYIMGVNEYALMLMMFKYTNWIKKHIGETTKELCFTDIEQITFYLREFEMGYEREPYNMDELRKFVLKPLNVTALNFDESIKNALKEFKQTGIVNDILKIGVFKKLQNKTTYAS